MKQIIIVGIAVLLTISCNDPSFKKSITDSGKTLTITVKANTPDKKIDYEKSFDVRDMSSEEKDKLKEHIFDSLGIKD